MAGIFCGQMTLSRSPDTSLTPDSRAHNLLLGANVVIDETATIGANVVIYDGVQIGPGVTIKNNCVIGELPSLAPDSSADAFSPFVTTISAGATICNGVVIIAGASIGERTIIGDHAFVRERSTIAEDCMIGRGCSVGVGARVGSRTKVQTGSGVLARMVVESDVVIGGHVTGVTCRSVATRNSCARE